MVYPVFGKFLLKRNTFRSIPYKKKKFILLENERVPFLVLNKIKILI